MSLKSNEKTQIVFDATRALISGVDLGDQYDITEYLPEFEPEISEDTETSVSVDGTRYGALRSRLRRWSIRTRRLTPAERPEWEMFLASTAGRAVFAISDRDNNGDIVIVTRDSNVQIVREHRLFNFFSYRFVVEEQP